MADEPEIKVELLTEELLIEEDVLLFSFLIAGNSVECLTNFTRNEDELWLNRLHLEGQAVNQVGRSALWQVAHQLGRYLGVKTLHVSGGRRTTGRYKGKMPTPFSISVPEL